MDDHRAEYRVGERELDFVNCLKRLNLPLKHGGRFYFVVRRGRNRPLHVCRIRYGRTGLDKDLV